MSLEVESFGATLSAANTDYSSPVAITKLIEFEPPEYEVENIQTSHMTTTAQTHTNQAGWIKPGKGKATILFDKTLIGTLKGYRGTLKGWIVTYVDGSTYKFNGYLAKDGEKVPMDKLVTYQFEIQASGVDVWTAGS